MNTVYNQCHIGQWRMAMIESGKSENTIRVYISDINLFSEFVGQDDLDCVELDTILEYRAWIIANYPKTTAMRRISSLRMFYTFLTELGIVLDFEPNDIAQLSFERISPIWLSNEQMAMLAEYANNNKSRIAIAIKVLLQTAIKKSELLSLSIDQIDTTDNTILIDIYPNHLSHKNRQLDCNCIDATNWAMQNDVTSRTLEYDLRSILDVLYGLDFDSNVTYETLRWNVIAQWYDNGESIADIQSRLGLSNASLDQITNILESR